MEAQGLLDTKTLIAGEVKNEKEILPSPYSDIEIERQKWLDSLEIPVVDRNDSKLKLIRKIGKGSYGKVFEGELNGKPVAVKIIRHITPERDDLTAEERRVDPQRRLRQIRKTFAGLTLAHGLLPDNFVEPIAQYNYKGKPSGIIMGLAEGTSLADDVDTESTVRESEKLGKYNLVYKPGRKPPKVFFDQLKSIFVKLYEKQLTFPDINLGAILRGPEDKPVLVDMWYGTIPPAEYNLNNNINYLNKLAGEVL